MRKQHFSIRGHPYGVQFIRMLFSNERMAPMEPKFIDENFAHDIKFDFMSRRDKLSLENKLK